MSDLRLEGAKMLFRELILGQCPGFIPAEHGIKNAAGQFEDWLPVGWVFECFEKVKAAIPAYPPTAPDNGPQIVAVEGSTVVVAADPDMEERLAADLRAARFSPPDNECASCGHGGWDHDLGNWCLVCPRPDDWDRTAKSPTRAKVDAGWCFFGSMTEPEQWRLGAARLIAQGWRRP